MSKGLLDDYNKGKDEQDPWSGEAKDFEPPKPIAPATYSFHIQKWGEFEGQSYVDMHAKIGDDSQNNSEVGRTVQHRFWANDKWRIKEFLQNVLGDHYQTLVDSQGGEIKIAYIAKQAIGYPFLADVFLKDVTGYDYPFADIDLKSVTAHPQGEVVIVADEESSTDFPFGERQ